MKSGTTDLYVSDTMLVCKYIMNKGVLQAKIDATCFLIGFIEAAQGQRDRIRERIRERIRDAKRHLASQGVFSGGKRPFGLEKVVDGDVVQMVPNAAEMAVIKQMQDMRAAGASLREIGSATGQGFRNVKRILERMAKG